MYIQGATNVTRMDYLAPLFNETVFSMAVEELLGVELPERAIWIRMLLNELNRCQQPPALHGHQRHGRRRRLSMMIYGWRERELVLAFLEKVTGLRMNHNFIRPGGMVADLPAGWQARRPRAVAGGSAPGSTSTTGSSPASPSSPSAPRASAYSRRSRPSPCRRTGPILRSTGVDWDLRRDQPYMCLRPGRLRRGRRHLRRCVRPVRDPARGDPPEPAPSASRSST